MTIPHTPCFDHGKYDNSGADNRTVRNQYDTLFALEFLGSRACREKEDGKKTQEKSKEKFNEPVLSWS